MKKRGVMIGLGVVVTLGVLLFLLDRLYYQPFSRQNVFADLVPPSPILYLHSIDLKAHVAHFADSPEYRTLQQSELLASLEKTAWWPEFRENFQDFWTSLIIDPMRIIGAEMDIAVYATRTGELVPQAILIGNVDRVAKIAERVLYGYDLIMHQVGVTFQQQSPQGTIYKIKQPDMICPVYYALRGDIGLVSTSLPVLQATLQNIRNGNKPTKPSDSAASHSTGNTSAHRFVTGYLDLAQLVQEFHNNPILRLSNWFQDATWQPSDPTPRMIVQVETDTYGLSIRTDWHLPQKNDGHVSESLAEIISTPPDAPGQFDAPPPDAPLVAFANQRQFLELAQVWRKLFPQASVVLADILPAFVQEIYGDVIECRLAEQLVGALYPLPDVTCLAETKNPGVSKTLLDTLFQRTVPDMLPPILRQALKISAMVHQNISITKIQFLLQEMLNYAVMSNAGQTALQGYTLAATNGVRVPQQVDALLTQPTQAPYLLTPSSPQAVLNIGLHPVKLASIFSKLAQTTTFALLFPPQKNPDLYQVLPWVTQTLQTLPPVRCEAGTTPQQGMYWEIRVFD